MSDTLVIIKNNELFTTTLEMSKGFGIDHRQVTTLLNKYKSEFEELGVITSAMQKPSSKKGGRPTEEIDLNQEQAMYMGTLFTNNAKVRKFKLQLVKEFTRLRKLLSKIISQKQNAEWLEKREAGKIERRIETDAILQFIEYAKNQGATPKGADCYYSNISSMENKALFYMELLQEKYPNIRNIIEGFQLDSLKMADRIVARALKEGMEKSFNYKDIYILAKDRVQGFAESLGKSPIQVCYIPQKMIRTDA